MPINYKLNFGGYDFPSTIRPDGRSASMDLGEQELPRAPGSSSQIGRRKSLPLSIRGEINADDGDALQTAYDALMAAVYNGRQQLFFGRDDRYYLAQVESVTDSSENGQTFGTWASIAINFTASDPLAWDVSPQTPALATTGGTITNGGTATSLPLWTVTIGAGGTGSVTIANTTTGETMVLSGTFTAGDVIAVDRQAYTVTLNGTAAFGLMSGRIPALAVGANAVTISAATVTVSAAAVSFTRRY